MDESGHVLDVQVECFCGTLGVRMETVGGDLAASQS